MTSILDYLLDRYGPTMTPSHVGDVLHRHPSHVRMLCRSGELPGVLIGSRWVVPTVEVAKILERRNLD